MSDTPKADAIRHDISKYRIYRDEYDGDWYPHFCQLERKLAAVTSERDRLRRAAELGLEYAETELQHRQKVYDGYPSRWELDEIYVAEIKAALRGEVQDE
jgi:hypothetical protein